MLKYQFLVALATCLLAFTYSSVVQSSGHQCVNPVDTGYGNETLERYFYVVNTLLCVKFPYKGKGGNGNNYKSEDECLKYCNNPEPNCISGPMTSYTGKAYERYYYNTFTKKCEKFTFYNQGMKNGNRYKTKEECEKKCAGE